MRPFRVVVPIQSHEAVDQRIENRHLLEVEQPVQVAAQIKGSLEYEARVVVLTGREIRRSQPVQRSQQRAIGTPSGLLNDLYAAQKDLFGRFEVTKPVLRRSQIGQWIDQRTISPAVLFLCQ